MVDFRRVAEEGMRERERERVSGGGEGLIILFKVGPISRRKERRLTNNPILLYITY